ncbi:MAG: trehalose-phosphatase [Candidatus Colwellbacteria bacterium]|nr:trehalose-phosphatase [Candidatus Colwellbacteria bacterium]
MLEHLLSVWPKVVQQFEDARHILLLADYDGTLTPIVDKPEMADLTEDTRQLIRSLAHQHHLTLGIISGRALADIKDKVGISNLIYAGNHGLEIEGPGISFVNPMAEELKPIIRVMHYFLSRALDSIKGVFVEDKGLTLTIHYRLAEKHRTGEVEEVVKQVAGGAEAMGKTVVTPGKKTYEVRPAISWDKGKAIKLLMKQYGKGGWRSGLLPIYIGDDITDEDGFRAIENYGKGLSVFVGGENQKTIARYFLKSPSEVTEFLDILLKEARKGFKN